MVLSGRISIGPGIILLALPIGGAVSLIRVIGGFTLIFGFSLILLSMRLKRAWREFTLDSN